MDGEKCVWRASLHAGNEQCLFPPLPQTLVREREGRQRDRERERGRKKKCCFLWFPASILVIQAKLWRGPIPAPLLNIDLIVCFCDGHIHHTHWLSLPNLEAIVCALFPVLDVWSIKKKKKKKRRQHLQWCQRVCVWLLPLCTHLGTQAIFTMHYQIFPQPRFVTLELH